MGKSVALHGRDHRPGGADPIPGIGDVLYDVKVIPDSDLVVTGDGQRIVTIPVEYNGWVLTRAEGYVTTASSSGLPTVQLRKVGVGDILSTKISIKVGEKNSHASGTTPSVIGSYATMATGDEIAVDVDIAGTDTQGLGVWLYLDAP